ncbi:DUF397 domain-containing protein [Streptomyces sp. NBC_01077]|uniref:DUF397 domain-containing protein n=1 Tax=Streptomyces sp. NBC_01077 TaxID=2903746 RepID=UPI0038635167|nr:DUF397 domain-containing protein [Streptomyces sp. NBC_01077]
MPSPQPSESTRYWFKSSYSGGNTTECVECAYAATGAFVRDSKRPEGPMLTLKATAWQDFVDSVSVGQLTPPSPGL